MARVIEPEVVNSAPPEKPVKKRRPQVRFKIRRLPPAVHRELDERLTLGNYQSLAEVADWLEREHQQFISPSSLAYYLKHDLDPTLQAVRIATAQAAEIVRASGGEDDEMSLALFRLVQTAIFDLLVQLNRTRRLLAMVPDANHRSAAILKNRLQKRVEDGAPNDEAAGGENGLALKNPSRIELAAVTALGKIVATINKAQVDWRKWRELVREKLEAKIAATSARVSEAAREGGLSPAAEEKIRAALLEIKL